VAHRTRTMRTAPPLAPKRPRTPDYARGVPRPSPQEAALPSEESPSVEEERPAVDLGAALNALQRRIKLVLPHVHAAMAVTAMEKPSSDRPRTARTRSTVQTLTTRLEQQVRTLRGQLAGLHTQLADLQRENSLLRAGSASSSSGSSAIREELTQLQSALSRAAKTEQAQQATIRRLEAEKRELEQLLAVKTDQASVAEAAASSLETARDEAERTLERMFVPTPFVGAEVEVQTKPPLTASHGAVSWRRGRVLGQRRHAPTGEPSFTVRLLNGRVEQDVPLSRVLLCVEDAAARRFHEETRRRVKERVEVDGAVEGGEEEDGVESEAPRRLFRDGVLVSDWALRDAPSSSLEQRWVNAVLERRCKQLAVENVRLRSQVKTAMGKVGLTEDTTE
jgi:hypothetical protein